MKKTACLLFFIIIALYTPLPSVYAEEAFPAITGPANDYANIISPDEEKRIGGMILAHRKNTGVQMAVLTVNTTGRMNIEEFSIRTAERWGGGSRERDDGLLFTVAVQDRRMRIEVGYGLEGYITDLRAGRILGGIREDFKGYKYGRGIEKAVTEIIRATGELRPGEEVPASVRLWGAFAHVVDFYILFYLLGGLASIMLILGRKRFELNAGLTLLAALCLFIAIPVLFQLFLHGVWYWTPVLYLLGAFAGAGITAAIMVPKKKASKIIAAAITAVPVLASMISVVYFLQILKPMEGGTTGHETALLGILIGAAMLQFFILAGATGALEGGESSYSGGDSGSSYSSGSSSSSSSGDSSYSGGGGSFGGGGASSSW